MPLLAKPKEKKPVKWFGRDPAVYLAALNALLALLVSFGAPWSAGVNQAIMVVATGVVTIISAAMVRPFDVPLTLGTIKTILVAVAAFGLHLSDVQVAAVLGVLSAIFAVVVRDRVTPKPAAKALR